MFIFIILTPQIHSFNIMTVSSVRECRVRLFLMGLLLQLNISGVLSWKVFAHSFQPQFGHSVAWSKMGWQSVRDWTSSSGLDSPTVWAPVVYIKRASPPPPLGVSSLGLRFEHFLQENSGFSSQTWSRFILQWAPLLQIIHLNNIPVERIIVSWHFPAKPNSRSIRE
jgi:hypothetical protein